MKKTIKLFVTAALMIACIVAASLFEVQDGVLILYAENGDCYIWEK